MAPVWLLFGLRERGVCTYVRMQAQATQTNRGSRNSPGSCDTEGMLVHCLSESQFNFIISVKLSRFSSVVFMQVEITRATLEDSLH